MMGWLGGWQYRKSHVINSASGAGTGYQVRIKAHYGSGTDSGEDVYLNSHCRTDFGDVRFTDDDGTTLLDYWMEEKVDSDYAVFWVEVADDLSSSSATIYVYYGKSDATTTSNGDNTFIFFDDFGGTSLDTNKWEESDTGGSYSVSDSVLTINGPATETIRSLSSFSYGKALGLGGLYVSNVGVANLYFHCGFWDFANTHVSLVQQYSSEGDRYGDYDGTYETTDFSGFTSSHKYEICWKDGTQVKYYQDDTLGATHSTHTTSTDKRIMFRVGGTGATSIHWIKVDYVYLRKYVDPEPSHGSWGSEETAGGQTYEVNVNAVVQSHATITKETIFNVEKDAAVSGQSLTAQEVGFNVVRDALVQASVVMQVLGVYPFNVEALVGVSADAQFRHTLGISRDAAVAVVSAPLFQSMFNVGSDAVLRVVAEAGVVKEGEVKVTRVFLVLGDLAIQLTGD